MRCWLMFVAAAMAGCSPAGTYTQSNHMFTATRSVPRDQPGWTQPEALKLHPLPTREDVHLACNEVGTGRKGSHFNVLGLHHAYVQDRGCYIHNDAMSVGRIYYLAGDAEALAHEKEHHLYGPAHTGPVTPRRRHVSGRSDARTGTRIKTAYGRGGI